MSQRQFTQTDQALQIDDFRSITFFLTIILVGFLISAGWFFLTDITIYASTYHTQWDRDDFIVASFFNEPVPIVYQGQEALVYLQDKKTKQTITTDAIIYAINLKDRQLTLLLDESLGNTTNLDIARVDIAIGTSSPAELVLKSAGLR